LDALDVTVGTRDAEAEVVVRAVAALQSWSGGDGFNVHQLQQRSVVALTLTLSRQTPLSSICRRSSSVQFSSVRYDTIRYDRWFALENWQASCQFNV